MIHSTAIISDKAVIADDVEIGPYTIIGDDVEIGSGTRIDSHCVGKVFDIQHPVADSKQEPFMKKIADVKAHILEAPLSEPFWWSFNRADMRTGCIVEIITEDGTSGWGECFGPARLNAAVIEAYRSVLVGEDALVTERLWQMLYNQFRDQGQKGVMITALSGVDIALWDLKGRHFQAPVGADRTVAGHAR